MYFYCVYLLHGLDPIIHKPVPHIMELATVFFTEFLVYSI